MRYEQQVPGRLESLSPTVTPVSCARGWKLLYMKKAIHTNHPVSPSRLHHTPAKYYPQVFSLLSAYFKAELSAIQK